MTLPAVTLDVVRCPRCGAPVTEDDGGLTCPDGHRMPRVDGVYRSGTDVATSEAAALVEGFGYEWERFPRILPEDEPFWDRYSVGLDVDAIGDDLAIDVGCGKGRFSWFLAPHVRHLVAFDPSSSAMVAARNLAERDNVSVFQADLYQAPFADASFGVVCCIGVLHYVPDPAAGFRDVVRLLAPGGRLVLSVYSRAEGRGVRALALRAAAALRRYTPRVPRPVLRVLCAPLALALYAGVVLPGQIGESLGVGALARLPMRVYRRRPLRSLWLDTFNRLHSPFEHRFVWAEVDAWLRDAGLEVVHAREDGGWMVVARRPTQAPATAS